MNPTPPRVFKIILFRRSPIIAFLFAIQSIVAAIRGLPRTVRACPKIISFIGGLPDFKASIAIIIPIISFVPILSFKNTQANNSQIASCRLLNQDKTIQPQGGFLPRLCRLAAWMLFIDDLPIIKHLIMPYHQNNLGFFKKNQHPGWLAGTALLVKRD